MAATALVAGCDTQRGESADEVSRPSMFGFQKSAYATRVEEGKAVYERYCVGCHGVSGDGKGDAAAFLFPRPRNFQAANFKFSSTRSGQLPADEDLERTIRGGLRGSSMPAFEYLSDQSIKALVAYVKTFSPKWSERQPAARIPLVNDPYRSEPDKSAAIHRGEIVYHGFNRCWTCHPAYVPFEKLNEALVATGSPPLTEPRPDIDQPVGKANSEGQLSFPPDFKRDFVRAGSDVDNLYRSIAAGITGTAMPTWIDSMHLPGKAEGDPPLVSPDDLWAVAYYVQSLIIQRPPRLDATTLRLRDRKYGVYLHGEPPPPAAEPESEDAGDVDLSDL